MKCPSKKNIQKLRHSFTKPYQSFFIFFLLTVYPRNEISTPAATAEPITPEILLDIQ